MTHQLHEGRQADAGADHIGREGVAKTVGVCDFDSASLAMMAEKRAQTRGSHPVPRAGPLRETNKAEDELAGRSSRR